MSDPTHAADALAYALLAAATTSGLFDIAGTAPVWIGFDIAQIADAHA